MALDQAKGIGRSAMEKIHESLLSTGLDIRDIFDLTKEELKNEFSFKEQIIDGIVHAQTLLESVEEVYQDLLTAHIEVVPFFAKNYPRQLDEHTAPLFYTFGNSSLLSTNNILTVVSASETSTKAETICYNTGKILGTHNIPLANGLNKGSGTLICSGQMEHNGPLLGVVPCGILTFHMSEKLMELFDPDRDCILSPFYPTAPISKYNAISRNSLMADLSQAVYIIEAPKTDEILLDTAKHTLKNNIPLYTTQFSEYPAESAANPDLMSSYKARKIGGKKSGNTLIPNLDYLISHSKLAPTDTP